MQLHLQEHRGQLPVLVPTRICSARRREDLQRYYPRRRKQQRPCLISGCKRSGLRTWKGWDLWLTGEAEKSLCVFPVCWYVIREGEAPWTCDSHAGALCEAFLRLVHARSQSFQHSCFTMCARLPSTQTTEISYLSKRN